MIEAKRRIWGWFFFDWASQPYNTLLLTFVFAPYVGGLMGDGSAAQTVWGYGIGAAGLVIAVLSPMLGAIADKTGRRMGFIVLFSIMYFVGAWGLWYASPEHFNVWIIMLSFGIGLIGMEFATTFTNAMLPDLGTADEIGRISGSGWAFGYLGGLLSLILVLTLFAENAQGKTLIGIAPILGLDAGLREGTRAVGPFSAIWYAVFMVPFFLWVREPRRQGGMSVRAASRRAWPDLMATLRGLPGRPRLFYFLIASMFYRDALNGLYTFGGIYAKGVLGWQITEIGVFGILTIITGAIFAWAGGRADSRFGPYPVILVGIVVLIGTTVSAVFLSREHVFGIATGPDSHLPDIAFYVIGALIGAAGGAMQSASRTMMLRLVDPAQVTEGFGLYALTGKATSFLAPFSIAVVTGLTGSQQLGFIPLIVLFLAGLVLLLWAKPNGGRGYA